MARNRVLLPEPDAPMISTRSPGVTSAVASSMMTLPSFIAIERSSKLSQPLRVRRRSRSVRFSAATTSRSRSVVARKVATRKTAERQSAIFGKLSTK